MIAKLRRNLRDWGVRGTLSNAWRHMREGYSREEVLVLLKDLDSIVEPRHPGDLRVEELEARHLPGIREMNRKRGAPERADRYFESCFAKGFHGFVALRGGEAVGYYWWVDRDADPPHPGLRRLGKGFALGEGDVYGDSLFLLEEHRGGNAAGHFLFAVESRLRELGYRRIWGYIAPANRPARWLYSSRGYRPMWKVVHRRLVFFKWSRSETLDEGAERR